jgi:hypothetical protein
VTRRAALAAVAILWGAGTAVAQELPTPVPRVEAPADTFPPPTAGPTSLRDPIGEPWQRPLASLIVPGTGQLMAGQSRGVVYLAMEAWVIVRAVTLNQRGTSQARQYRDLAYQVARTPFTTVRVDGPFEYYETMEKFVESGVFDTDPTLAFAPESDTLTYNGSVWLLARRTYFSDPNVVPPPSDPAYVAAVRFYTDHAVTDEFRWSWRNARLEQDVYRQQIHASDRAFQQRTNYLGLLLLNHLASAVDALISLRRGPRPQAAPHLSFPGPTPSSVALQWTWMF